MKLVLTGAAGMVGSRFFDLLKGKYDITPLAGSFGIDITDRNKVRRFLTDANPAVIVHMAAKTNVDALAIAIGTSHGAYKFTREPTGDILAIEQVKKIHAAIPNTHLVMHGSSSVPQEWLQIIRENGGELKETYGVPVFEIQTAIKHGVRKINIDTDIRQGFIEDIRRISPIVSCKP